jgi:hypothetical protein
MCQICCSLTSNFLSISIKSAVHQHQTGRTLQHCPFISIELSFNSIKLTLYQDQTGWQAASNTAAKLLLSASYYVQQRHFGRSAVSNWLVITATHNYVLSHVLLSLKPLGLDTNVTTNLSQNKLSQFSLICHHYVLCYNVWYTNWRGYKKP